MEDLSHCWVHVRIEALLGLSWLFGLFSGALPGSKSRYPQVTALSVSEHLLFALQPGKPCTLNPSHSSIPTTSWSKLQTSAGPHAILHKKKRKGRRTQGSTYLALGPFGCPLPGLSTGTRSSVEGIWLGTKNVNNFSENEAILLTMRLSQERPRRVWTAGLFLKLYWARSMLLL